jgi:hypothetical protein
MRFIGSRFRLKLHGICFLSRVLFERSMDRYRCALEHHKAVCPEIWCCGSPSGMLGSYARIALVPPERPDGYRWPGRLHRKDLS